MSASPPPPTAKPGYDPTSTVLITLAVLLILYPLSVGPLVAIVLKATGGAPPPRTVIAVTETFYYPLEWASKNDPTGMVDEALRRYVEMCCYVAGARHP